MHLDGERPIAELIDSVHTHIEQRMAARTLHYREAGGIGDTTLKPQRILLTPALNAEQPPPPPPLYIVSVLEDVSNERQTTTSAEERANSFDELLGEIDNIIANAAPTGEGAAETKHPGGVNDAIASNDAETLIVALESSSARGVSSVDEETSASVETKSSDSPQTQSELYNSIRRLLNYSSDQDSSAFDLSDSGDGEV